MIFEKSKSLCNVKQKIIVCEENRQKYIANNVNNNRVFKYNIDGDILPSGSSQLRCDFLVENETKKNAYLIELKGKNVEHAIDQINATVRCFKAQLCGYTVFPRIVYRRNTHGVRSSKANAFRIKYPKSRIETNVIEENI